MLKHALSDERLTFPKSEQGKCKYIFICSSTTKEMVKVLKSKVYMGTMGEEYM